VGLSKDLGGDTFATEFILTLSDVDAFPQQLVHWLTSALYGCRMAGEQKTLPTGASVEAFLSAVEPPRRRDDAYRLAEIMKRVTGLDPVMWGPSLIGYGQYEYTYDSGHSGTFFRTGFSPRKQRLSIYIMPDLRGHDALLAQLGKHKTGAGCLYINKLADVDLDVLEALIRAGLARIKELYG